MGMLRSREGRKREKSWGVGEKGGDNISYTEPYKKVMSGR